MGFKMEGFPRVSIIILNWNGWRDTIECLESLYQITYPNYEVIVVDNGSKDNSAEKIKEYCEGKTKVKSKFFEYDPNNKPIYILEYAREQAEEGGDFKREKYFSKYPSNRKLRLILNEKNYGFAEGNNIGIRYALKALNPDYILLLNNDTVVDPEFLMELVNVAESDPKIGFAGPKTYYYDFNGRRDVINFAGGKLSMWKGKPYHIGMNEVDVGQYDEIREVDYVEGSCILVSKNVINRIGLLSTDYPLYWEENDWCIRGQKANFKSVYVPDAKIWHKTASSIKKELSGLAICYMTQSRFIFMKKYASTANIMTFLLYFIFQFWYNIGSFLKDGQYSKIKLYLKGILQGLRSLSE